MSLIDDRLGGDLSVNALGPSSHRLEHDFAEIAEAELALAVADDGAVRRARTASCAERNSDAGACCCC